MATTNMRIVIRRDTKANWDANSQVVLLQGEQGLEINVDQTGVQRPTRVKVGDGISQWGQLPYFGGGITAIDADTIIMDASGKIMVNTDLYLGDLTNASGDSVSVKDYVDAKVAVEAEARTNGDTALGNRIDLLETKSDNNDTALSARLDVLEADPTTKTYVDGLVQAAADSISTLDTELNSLDQKVDANKLTSDQGDIALEQYIDSVDARLIAADTTESAARAAADDSIVGLLVDSVATLEDQLAEKADLDSVASVLRDVDSYVGNYQGGATISDDLVTLADKNTAQDTALNTLIAGDTAFTGSITAPGFNGDLAGNAATATLAAEASDAESGGALDTRIGVLEADPTTQSAVDAVQADVDQNEADADAAIAALQADVDQNESDADAAIAAVQADVDANEATAAAASSAAQTKADANASTLTALKAAMESSSANTIAELAAEIAGAL